MFNKYPYTDFHELNLDWFLSEFKTLFDAWVTFKGDVESAIDAMEQDIESFKQFVTDYLDNLDYAQVINDYIDQMIADGTFLTVVSPTISSYVTDWLNDNVTPVGSAVIVDSGLTISGAAADALVTGNKLNVENDISLHIIDAEKIWANGTPLVDIGSINPSTGANADSVTNRCRLHDLASCTAHIFKITVDSNYRVAPYFYYLPEGGGRTYLGYQSWLDSNEGIIISDLDFNLVNFTFKRTDDAVMTAIDTTNIADSFKMYLLTDPTLTEANKPADAKVTGTRFTFQDDFNNHVLNGEKIFNTPDGLPTVEIGNINPSNGNDAPSVTNRIHTGFASITSHMMHVTVDSNYLIAPFFYYVNAGGTRTYVGYQTWTDSNDDIIISDLNFNLVKFTFKRLDNATMTASDLTTIANTFKIYMLTDTTLTQSGVPADAKTVGDLLGTGSAYYRGLKYVALGDSITYGFIPRNYTGYPGQLKSFAALTAEKLGMIFNNYGISGSTLAYVAGRNPMSRRWQNLPDDADIISVMGGTNDIRNGVQLGTFSDSTDSTYYGALHVVLGGLYKKYFIDQGTEVGATKKIVVCTPIKLLDQSASTIGGTGTLVNFQPWVDAVKEVATYYSLPVLDFYDLSGINPHLNETVQGYEAGYTGFYNPYITDGTHPTQEGAEIMSDVFTGFLASLV